MDVPELVATARSTVRRRAQRGSHDRRLIHAILDAGRVCHVAWRRDESTIVLPMAYGRSDDTLFLHGARSAGVLTALAGGVEACVSVTLLDGLVLAKSAFHHSMNYRSVVLFGRARPLEQERDKLHALTAIVEHALPGRMSECRTPTSAELSATGVLAFPIDEGSAKVRAGGPIEDPADEALPHWSGVVPLALEPLPSALPHSVERALLCSSGWPVTEERRGALHLSTDPARIDVDTVHRYLCDESYWARGIPRARLVRALSRSLCVSVHDGDRQVGFGRIVSDGATIAYLADVFVVPSHRARGIAGWMLEHLRARPDLAGLRRWLLGTRDAHEVYARHGFQPLAEPGRFMEIVAA